MTKIKQKKALTFLVSLLTVGVGFVFLHRSVEAELAPGSAQLDENFANSTENYAKNLPNPGPFMGGKEADMEGVSPFIYSPFTQFNLAVDKSQKQAYQKGEIVDLKGTLSYKLQTKEEFGASIKRGCQAVNKVQKDCITPDIYNPHFADLGVFIQVWRKDDSVNSKNGDFLVDEFYTLWGMQLKEKETKDFNLKWRVPDETVPGDYYFSLFVNSNRRFSVLGEPFQTFTSGFNYNFNVSGSGENGVELDKDNIEIGGNSFVYRRSAPEITSTGGEIAVQIPVKNLDNVDRSVKLSYELSAWSQENSADTLDSNSEIKGLAAGDEIIYKVVVKSNNINSVQNLKIIAQTDKSKSIANIRFAIKGNNQGIFRFLGLASQEESKDVIPMFCLRNAQYEGYFSGKVRLTVASQGDSAVVWEKDGDMIANQDRCFVVKDSKFRFKRTSPITIKGEIFDRNGRLTDKKEISYPLQESTKNGILENYGERVNEIWGTKKILAGAIIVLITAILGIIIYFKKIQTTNDE